MARDDVLDFGNPFDPQKRKLDGTFDGPKPLESVWDVPKSEGGGWLSAPTKGDSFFADLFSVPQAKARPKESLRPGRQVDRRNGAEVAKLRGGKESSAARTLIGYVVIIALLVAAVWFLIL